MRAPRSASNHRRRTPSNRQYTVAVTRQFAFAPTNALTRLPPPKGQNLRVPVRAFLPYRCHYRRPYRPCPIADGKPPVVRYADYLNCTLKISEDGMRTLLAVAGLTIAAVIAASEAHADARQDCAKLSGDAATGHGQSATTREMRSRTTTAASNTGTRASTTGPSPTTPRPSRSIRSTRTPTAAAATRYGQGDYDRAIADYTKAIEIDRSTPRPTSAAASRTQAKGDYDRAIADYNKAIEIDRARRRLLRPRRRIAARATTTARSPTTPRPSRSTPKQCHMPKRPRRRHEVKGELRPRDRRLHQGHRDQPALRQRLPRPRARLPQGRQAHTRAV